MRIALITTSYPRSPDDPAGSFVAGHADWLVAQGHAVEVICAGDPDRSDSRSAPAGRLALRARGTPGRGHAPWQPGVEVTAVPAPPGLFYAGGAPEHLTALSLASLVQPGSPGSLAASWRAARHAAGFTAALTRVVARRCHAWDAVYAHWLVPGGLVAALVRAARRSGGPGFPIAAIAHSGDVHLARRLHLVPPLAATLAAGRARLAFVSRSLRRRFVASVVPASLRRHIARGSIVTPMGISTARFRAIRARRQVRGAGREPAANRSATVLFVGRLVPIKGVGVLLAAARELPAGTRVIIAGDGPERALLEARAKAEKLAGVEFAGQVSPTARDRLLARADALVLPSIEVTGGRSEGTPVTAVEAMAAGVPVIASRTGGLGDLPPGTVTWVPPGQPCALARALLATLSPTLDDAMRQEARVARAARHADTLDWSHVGPRLHALVHPKLP